MEHKVTEVPVAEIFVDEDFNCRGHFAPIDVVDLAKDIDRQGLIQPVTLSRLEKPFIVTERGKQVTKQYRLLAGFRRYKATALVLKREMILAVVRADIISEVDARIINLAENIHRKDLNILQEAKAIRHLFTLLSEEQIATRLGQARGWVTVRAMLLKLPDAVQREVEVGLINHTNIRELYAIHKSGNMDSLYAAVREIKDKKLRGFKSVSVDPKKKTITKRYRGRAEIERMAMALVDKKMAGLTTRALAWAAGNITTDEFLEAVYTSAEENAIDFVPFTPEEISDICGL